MHARVMLSFVLTHFSLFSPLLHSLFSMKNNSQKKHSATSINNSNTIKSDIDNSMPLIPNATATTTTTKHQTKMINNGTTNRYQIQTIDKLSLEKMSQHHNRNSFNIETISLLFMFIVCAITYSSKCSNFFNHFFPFCNNFSTETVKIEFECAMRSGFGC